MANQRGFMLLLSLFTVMFLAGWCAILFQSSVTQMNVTTRYAQQQQVFQLAESGLDDAHRWLGNQPTPPSGTAAFDPLNGAQALGNGSYSITIDPDDANPTNYLDLFTITVTGQLAGGTRQLSSLLHAESFSRFSYFTNYEKMADGITRIWFNSSDHLWGPVQSNDQFNIAGNPIFDGRVTSAASSIFYKNPPPVGGNNPQFNGGVSLSAGTITLPLSSTRLRVAAASAGGTWYTGNTTITLQPDGTMLVTNATLGWTNNPQPAPANGAIFVNGGNVTVSGTMHGKLTIGTSHDIVVPNNVTYADNPQTNPSSTDILGLVAERNVVVSSTAPFNLTIQASVMALQSSVTVANWWVGPPKGTLNIYGGIIQDRRGPVCSISAATGNRLSGYGKDYRYDTRFSSLAPPSFPTTGQYDEILWLEQ